MVMHPLRLAASADGLPDFDDDFAEVRVTIYMGFVSFTILVWEHMITFSDEVEYIWKGHKGLLTYLFLLNRYLTPLGFIINLFAYLSPTWTTQRCQHFVRYEGSMTVTGINTTALMMLVRVYAMYSTKLWIVSGVAALFLLELAVNAWLLSNGTAVIHHRSIHACTMIFSSSVKHIASASAWLPLLYDTVVLILTLYRTVGPIRRKTAGKIARVLLRDGILYYSVIFSINLVLTVMIAAAPPGIQNITAQLEYLLTVAMMSRITLHLRKQARAREEGETDFLGWAGLRSRLRFTHTGGRSGPPQQSMSVTVEETSVVHDDRGIVLREREYEDSATHSAQSRKAAATEWYEMERLTPPHYPPPVRLAG